MASSVVISFKDIDPQEKVRETVEERCEVLAEEFPETTRFEVILSSDGASWTAHGHVTGNHTEVAGHGDASELAVAADKLLEQLARQLRKIHDKKIFAQRREAQRASVRRRSG
ncbi:MAG: HPF/RaiA family ribosome-associated protein [Deltaproteobacteria bacterium]|nr:HPF/RaiA family ribosome-associated protein [Deltaproteobacteria bacterium]MBW2371599.1 HPF/RaiA family ribosome-associated protein [Deltaproteobacteria bacterium]